MYKNEAKNHLDERQNIWNIPNSLSVFRIICSVTLLFVKPLTMLFFSMYVIGGCSDMLDGFIARKYKMKTDFGALLDSIADTFLIAVLCYVMIPILPWEYWMLTWFVAIVVIKILSLMVGAFKFHTFATLHTYGNKITGFALFLFPIMLKLFGIKVTSIVLCMIATLAAVEEFMIIIFSRKLNRDMKWMGQKSMDENEE